MFRARYGDVFKGDENWREIQVEGGLTYRWSDGSTYVQNPPYFADMKPTPEPLTDIDGARILGLFLDSITTDHISPAGSIKRDGPAGEYLISHQVRPVDFNSYGARRGNHEVMMRGTFANIRIKNQMVPGVEGGVTIHYPSGERMSIYDAAMRYAGGEGAARHLRRQGIRHRLVARLGGQGHAAARRARGDRAELRAHPPLQPRRHGRAAAGARGRHELADPRPEGRREGHASAASPTSSRARSRRAEIAFADGRKVDVPVLVRIDTLDELEYFRHGGILHYVLRNLVKQAA